MTETTEMMNSSKFAETSYQTTMLINQEEYFYQIHRAQQAMIDPKYKTELCKSFIAKGMCRYKYKCRFAHGINDLMKKPNDKVIMKVNSKIENKNISNCEKDKSKIENNIMISEKKHSIKCCNKNSSNILVKQINENSSLMKKELNYNLDSSIDQEEKKENSKFNGEYSRQDSLRTSTTTNYASTKLNLSGDINEVDYDSTRIMQDMYFLFNLTDSTKKYRRLRLFERMTDGSMS